MDAGAAAGVTRVRNPILRGFHPDPSIVRVDEEYFIATSTFEWFPGVRIHRSRDLASWTLAARPLHRASQLDLRGDPDSGGVWAPDLSHAAGRFHLVYTDVKRYGRTTVNGAGGASLRDFHNYWVWCDRIDGDWSDPVHLNSSGFDPALFHDRDGSSWLLNMLWDHRPGPRRFAGIVAQRMDMAAGQLVGERRVIFEGTALGFTEAPHLYQHGGWYHLLVAEGGTGWDHAAVMARSRSLLGPYELHPDGPVLTAAGDPRSPLARTGHGDLVETPAGETWMAYLCGRPLPGSDRCVLGRETAIQPMAWGADGWLRTVAGNARPVVDCASPLGDGDEAPFALLDVREDFDGAELPEDFQWLRTPYSEQIWSVAARPGHLRLHGRETIGSLFTQALVARRQQAFRFTATCALEVDPRHFQQAAGLVCYYNSSKYHYLHVTADSDGRHLRVLSAMPDAFIDSALTAPVPVPDGVIQLRADVDLAELRFAWRVGAGPWCWLPERFDASLLSDEATLPGLPNFTGSFVGMACQDLAGTAMPADFDWFRYRERDAADDGAR